jgi:SAM-dependent methyltransferase
MNKILGDEDRVALEPLIREMFLKCPEMMARKYPDANVQQAFVLNEVLKLNSPKDVAMLCVGCVEDTAAEYLKVSGYNVIGIDPEINLSLADYKKIATNKFNIIFSTSVIEHVPDDEQFTKDICELLNVGGHAILTCDFREAPGKVHPLDVRFYKEFDLLRRLGNIIASYNCELVGEPNWKGEPNFWYDHYHYGFATWMFTKTSA